MLVLLILKGTVAAVAAIAAARMQCSDSVEVVVFCDRHTAQCHAMHAHVCVILHITAAVYKAAAKARCQQFA